MKKAVVFIALICFSISFLGCATKSDNISAAYVSPIKYQNYNCDQINQEMIRIGHRVAEISSKQDAAAASDALAMVFFWPAALMTEDHKAELSELKGEYDALESAAIQNQCTQAIETAKALNDARDKRTAEKAKLAAEAKVKKARKAELK